MAPENLEKLPPQNLEAEQSVLGSLLIDQEAIIQIADILTPEDFYKDAHRIVYATICELYTHHEPVDVLNLSNALEEKNQLPTIGGRSYLASLASAVPTASNVVSYAQIVRKKATLRRLIHSASGIAELGYHEEGDLSELLDKAEQSLFGVSQRFLKQAFVVISNILTGTFDRIDDLHKQKGKLRGLPTNFSELDSKLAGLQKSDLVILAARPSMGKSSLALDIARNVATKSNVPVGIFSLEMSKESIVDRMLCAEADIDLWKMRTGNLSDKGDVNDFTKLGYAMGTLSEAPIYIDDSAGANIMEIRTKARRLQAEHGLGLIIIDYLQLMESSSGSNRPENRVQEVSAISRGLKAIARELDVPVLALSQLSRSVESRMPPSPKLADLRESGSIEQDADVVLFIYREGYYKEKSEFPNVADIFIAKHRNGPTGRTQLFFDANRASFKNLDRPVDTGPEPEF